METKRIKGCYTVVRYTPDIYNGEVINVGLIIHTQDGMVIANFISDEHMKIKTFGRNSQRRYKFAKDKIAYYLKETNDLIGSVGSFEISSPSDTAFIERISKAFTDNQISFSKPRGIISADMNRTFNNLFLKYIGHENDRKNDINTKVLVTKLFEEHKLLNNKIKKDFKIKPVVDLNNITMKIDFVYKNGVWNYMQVIPKIKDNKSKLDFIGEIKMLFDSVDEDTSIKLIYNHQDEEIGSILNYLKKVRQNVEDINLNDAAEVEGLLKDIELHAKDNINELLKKAI
ncbi:DUF3037 domain-containing protein [Macrococcus bovicus]|uniref:DUF3037 domain-containing protein n=1 Tax=Macrococcus bovicus TaxID=69968 RepID=UPI0025A4E6D7|nr:DUF3037 domain-containing protein [Macrococcus bovicus]WJP98449.1 DUF3037 domain-containing protein [Macrococcus bovicus]